MAKLYYGDMWDAPLGRMQGGRGLSLGPCCLLIGQLAWSTAAGP